MKSTTLDKWESQWVDIMTRAGNVRVNACFEARLTDRSRKLRPTSTMDERERYIRAKYERREFFGQPTKESLMRACVEVDMPFNSLPPNYITGVDTTAIVSNDVPGSNNQSTNPALLRRQQKKDAEEGAIRKAAEDAERDSREKAAMEARLRLEQEQASIRATTSSLGDLFGGNTSNQSVQRTQNAASSILAQFNAPSVTSLPFNVASSTMLPQNPLPSQSVMFSGVGGVNNSGGNGNLFDSMSMSLSSTSSPFQAVSSFPTIQPVSVPPPQPPQTNLFASMSLSQPQSVPTTTTTSSSSSFSLATQVPVSAPVSSGLSSTGFSFMGSTTGPVMPTPFTQPPLAQTTSTSFGGLNGITMPTVSMPNKTAALSSFLDAVAADAAVVATTPTPSDGGGGGGGGFHL
jgi:hypothetical protein